MQLEYIQLLMEIYRAYQKSIALKNFANFSRTVEKYDTILHITHSTKKHSEAT